MVKKILLALVVVLVVLQFFRPQRNTSPQLITDNDISQVYPVQDEVHRLLQQKCYDCHSNHTNYPWYFSVQPLAWWLAHHIEEGKRELNFSEFKTYEEKRALHKLEEIAEVTEDSSMPLQSYVVLHPHAKLTEADQRAIMTWLNNLPVQWKKSDH